MQAIHPFKPLIFKNSETLILGSFPSLKSFENSFYYAHPQNQFWKILSEITGYPARSRDQRIWLLKETKLALWDVVKSCRRENSSDSNLKDIVLNDIGELLDEYPNVKRIGFTSKLAQKLYNTHSKALSIETFYLPSPSPAYAAMKFEDKVKKYSEILFGQN
ncbi:MAG TPA: DNA-deoxyinosine glycosylase [Nitratifractor sp.]|jgi:TDG/mug DNA glycosylase family protein|nr:DNA-deoxyinosine glycosylase [Nitratifractor sp.]HHD74671.1 DNA-deoxyinosine glycosylase [Nitratifractor sp.]